MTINFSQTAAFIWSVADLLRGDFKQSQYGRIILPFTLLRRLECVLESSKPAVLAKHAEVSAMNLPEEAYEKMVLRATDESFFNISLMDLSRLGEAGIKDNLERYIQCFSKDAREIFEYFKFAEFIGQLNDANLLYKVVQKFANTDLSPKAISPARQMGAAAIVDGPCHDFNLFEEELKKALKVTGVSLDVRERKQLLDSVSWKNPEAKAVIKKVHKEKANPLYGLFAVGGKVVEFQANDDLRDNENIPLDPSRSVTETVEAYFKKEVAPHVTDAWIDAGKRDEKDGELGIVGYEIAFNRHFYVYTPPRGLVEIDRDLDLVSGEIMALLREVHS